MPHAPTLLPADSTVCDAFSGGADILRASGLKGPYVHFSREGPPDAALDVVVDEAGEKWAVHVRRARFEAHNREWLDACGGDGSFDEHSGHSEPGGRAFDARRDGEAFAAVALAAVAVIDVDGDVMISLR